MGWLKRTVKVVFGLRSSLRSLGSTLTMAGRAVENPSL
jgi:hypothetical protein